MDSLVCPHQNHLEIWKLRVFSSFLTLLQNLPSFLIALCPCWCFCKCLTWSWRYELTQQFLQDLCWQTAHFPFWIERLVVVASEGLNTERVVFMRCKPEYELCNSPSLLQMFVRLGSSVDLFGIWDAGGFPGGAASCCPVAGAAGSCTSTSSSECTGIAQAMALISPFVTFLPSFFLVKCSFELKCTIYFKIHCREV